MALVAIQVGCFAAVRGAYGPYDTNQCYWNWVEDGYGGYEQLHCWAPGMGAYYQYAQGGTYVRRYPTWYSGQRVVVTPPVVGLVQPRGVVIAPPPMAMPGRPPPMGGPGRPPPMAMPGGPPMGGSGRPPVMAVPAPH